MKLSRKQELALIDIGLSIHLDRTLFHHKEVKRNKKDKKTKSRKWSKKQRAKFIKSMRAKWDEKRKLRKVA